jgi:hypothetical protein
MNMSFQAEKLGELKSARGAANFTAKKDRTTGNTGDTGFRRAT